MFILSYNQSFFLIIQFNFDSVSLEVHFIFVYLKMLSKYYLYDEHMIKTLELFKKILPEESSQIFIYSCRIYYILKKKSIYSFILSVIN